ncbi:MAG TPA: copper resistance CopC family protein, partial [Rugosimonospora sp.]|nr:copper resistance CopC family protein [Rugosimonospora sp.]
MRRRWRAPAAAVLLALGYLLLTATPAAAHAELVGSTPPSGAHLDRAPAEVVLRFSEQVTPVTGAVRLLDGAGRQVSRSGAARVPGHADWIRLPVPPDLPDGGYVAVWRVISADSHPVDGSVLFTVGNAQAAPLSGVTGVTPPGGTGTLFWLVRGLGFAALALFVGGLGFLAVCWPAGRDNPRARRLVLGGYLASVATAVAALLVQGVYAAGRPLTEVFSPDLVAATLHTGYGVFAVAGLALLAAGGGLLWR